MLNSGCQSTRRLGRRGLLRNDAEDLLDHCCRGGACRRRTNHCNCQARCLRKSSQFTALECNGKARSRAPWRMPPAVERSVMPTPKSALRSACIGLSATRQNRNGNPSHKVRSFLPHGDHPQPSEPPKMTQGRNAHTGVRGIHRGSWDPTPQTRRRGSAGWGRHSMIGWQRTLEPSGSARASPTSKIRRARATTVRHN